MKIEKSNGRYIHFLKTYACKSKLFFLYFLIVLFIALNTFISLIRPKLQGEIIDDLSNPSKVKESFFIVLLVVFLAMLIINYVVIYLQKYIVSVISEEIAADVRQSVHDKLATVQVSFFDCVELSDILLKIEKDVDAVKQCGITSIITLFSNVTILIVVPPYMLLIHKGIAISNILLLVCVPFISRILGTLIQQASENVLQGYNATTNALTNSYNNWFIVRIFYCYRYIHNKYKDKNQRYRRATNRQNLLYILNSLNILVVQFIGTVIIWIVGAKEVFDGNMTIGTIMVLMNYQTIIMNPIIGIADFANEYHTAIVSLKDIEKLLNYPDTESAGGKNIKKVSELSLCNVGFQYQNAECKVLKNINFSFQAGKIYAIHGKSGQGKSTLFKLLAGIYEPTEGQFYIDGTRIQDCNIQSYWKRIGFVMQRTSFFKDSIEKNINLFEDVPIDKMDEMAKCLDLYKEIHDLPETWNTEVKTDPCNLSEGQMRRLDIMRNIIKNPDVLIFDEVTANIDGKRRMDFYNLLRKLAENKIIIFSTHNADELREADIVINLSTLCGGEND